jgi:hypothetical protein
LAWRIDQQYKTASEQERGCQSDATSERHMTHTLWSKKEKRTTIRREKLPGKPGKSNGSNVCIQTSCELAAGGLNAGGLAHSSVSCSYGQSIELRLLSEVI